MWKIFDFRCQSCNHEFEELVDPEELHNVTCSICGGRCKKLFITKASGLRFFPEGIGKHISSENKTITNFEELKKHCRETSTSTNIKWPEYFDGISNPGMPTGWVEEVRQEKLEEEKKQCQEKQERINKMARQATPIKPLATT